MAGGGTSDSGIDGGEPAGLVGAGKGGDRDWGEAGEMGGRTVISYQLSVIRLR